MSSNYLYYTAKAKTRKIMGDIGFIFGYTIVGAFLLGAVVGYIASKVK